MAFKVDNQMDVESTMGEKIYSTEISAAGMENLMPLFIGLYGDSYLAVLREYVSNALDSHIAAGVDAPVLVTLPSAFSPQLVVADQGLGLSLDEIGSRLVQYGESDKEVDGWMSGGYGVGAKCAWAVSPHFIVEAVKDGRRVIVQLALNESGRGEVFLLESEDTSDPNGVTVTVPIDDYERMARVAEKFFSTWMPGSVLVNGEQPAYALGDMAEDAPGIRVARKRIGGFDGGVLFLLNHVAYPVGREMMTTVADRLEASGDRGLADLARGLYRQVFVECRKSDFVPVPTREAVRDDEISLRTLESVFRRIGVAAQQRCTEVSAASNVAAACRAAVALDDWLAPFKELREQTQPLWRGRRLYAPLGRDSFRLLVRREGAPTNFLVRRTSADPLAVRDVAMLTVVTGCTDASSVAKVNGYARAFFAERADREVLVAVDSDGTSDDSWFECGPDSGVETVTLSDFVKRYAPAKQAARASVGGSDVSYRVTRRTDGARWETSTMSVAALREHDGPVVVGNFTECPRSLPLGDVVVVDLERKSGSALTKRVPGAETVAAFTERLLAGIEWSQHESIIATSKAASLRAGLSTWSKTLGEERWAQVRHEGVLRVLSLPDYYGLTAEQKNIVADWRMVSPDANPSVAVVQRKTAWIDDVKMDVPLLSVLSAWQVRDNDAAKNDVVAYINMKAGVK